MLLNSGAVLADHSLDLREPLVQALCVAQRHHPRLQRRTTALQPRLHGRQLHPDLVQGAGGAGLDLRSNLGAMLLHGGLGRTEPLHSLVQLCLHVIYTMFQLAHATLNLVLQLFIELPIPVAGLPGDHGAGHPGDAIGAVASAGGPLVRVRGPQGTAKARVTVQAPVHVDHVALESQQAVLQRVALSGPVLLTPPSRHGCRPDSRARGGSCPPAAWPAWLTRLKEDAAHGTRI
mmetsp:Transcript_115347/g.337228  ORF Transcript_115347/g.337228 Transcript_115347/m.337228 type:complete len:233 (+) Transcript_115347:766-1464(+)